MINRGHFKARIMDAAGIQRALHRIAHQILERNPNADFALVGIHTRGVPLAQRLASIIKGLEGQPVTTGAVEISLYRDDLTEIAEQPHLKRKDIDFDVNGKVLVVVDDVLYTGRTLRTALNALMEGGSPKLVQAAVLIDRGRRRLPLHADYVGKNVPTAGNEIVHVLLKETDGEDQVILAEKD
jgi:pyrimidine operon attenuation protein/uracil phosphoribosyltransferase